MKNVQLLRPPSLASRQLPNEETPSNPTVPNGLLQLTLGGAICGGFAGSFVGAVLGMAVGIVYHDISMGLDGALLGGGIAAAAGAVYGLLLALNEKSKKPSSDCKNRLS